MFFLSSALALYEAVNFGIQQHFPDGLEVLWLLRGTEQRLAEPKQQQDSKTRIQGHLPSPGTPRMRFCFLTLAVANQALQLQKRVCVPEAHRGLCGRYLSSAGGVLGSRS